MDIKDDLAMRMFDHLNANLDEPTKMKIQSGDMKTILYHIADWVYDERKSILKNIKNKNEFIETIETIETAFSMPKYLEGLD